MQVVDIIHTNYKKYKSHNDLNNLEMKSEKPKIVFHPAQLPKYPKECVSYSVFLQKNPGASKKQRVEAIQRFYDSLY
jgi:hypothetical protein